MSEWKLNSFIAFWKFPSSAVACHKILKIFIDINCLRNKHSVSIGELKNKMHPVFIALQQTALLSRSFFFFEKSLLLICCVFLLNFLKLKHIFKRLEIRFSCHIKRK